MGELRTFVFSLTFIIIFAGLLVSVPTDLQGSGETVDIVTPLEPSLIADFESTANWSAGSFVSYGTHENYEYSFISRDWVMSESFGGLFELGAKVYYAGWLFIGVFDYVNFISPTGNNIGVILSFDQIDADASNGTVRYDLQYDTGGSSAGALVLYWNATAYASSLNAWGADELYFLHGAGIISTANMDIVSLLVSLLLLQLPDVPILINLFLATPLYACVVYMIWFLIKETLPFI